jgi:hypothetical protein
LIVLDIKWKIIADKIINTEKEIAKPFPALIFDLAQRLGPNDIQKSKEEKCAASFREAFEKGKGYEIEIPKTSLNTKKKKQNQRRKR